jgi:hypothetical protein
VGTNKGTSITWPVTPGETRIYGGDGDLWGTTWTRGEVAATTFGVHYVNYATADNADIYLDHVRITVYYTVPAVVTGSATIQATASVSAGGRMDVLGSATVKARSTTSDGAIVNQLASATVLAETDIQASGLLLQLAMAVLQAAGAISATGTIGATVVTGSALLEVAAQIVASALNEPSGAATVQALSSITANGINQANAAALLTTGAFMQAAALLEALGTGTLGTTTVITASARAEQIAAALLETASAIMATGKTSGKGEKSPGPEGHNSEIHVGGGVLIVPIAGGEL